MATPVLNVQNIPGLLNADTSPTSIPDACSAPRVTKAPFPLNLAGGGGVTDPVGPQRWPTKL
jgi:hypothetical protein